VVRLYETVASGAGAFARLLWYDRTQHRLRLLGCEQTQAETGLPCTDPVRFGAETLLNAVMGIRLAGSAKRKYLWRSCAYLYLL